MFLEVVNTPDFGDSSGSDNKLIQDMMDILKNKLGYTNMILLLMDGNMPRLSSGLSDMLHQMNDIFGETLWDFMMIGVNKVNELLSSRLHNVLIF